MLPLQKGVLIWSPLIYLLKEITTQKDIDLQVKILDSIFFFLYFPYLIIG